MKLVKSTYHVFDAVDVVVVGHFDLNSVISSCLYTVRVPGDSVFIVLSEISKKFTAPLASTEYLMLLLPDGRIMIDSARDYKPL